MILYFALMLIGVLGAVSVGVALAWDGSAFLFTIVDSHTFFIPRGRNADAIVQIPVVVGDRFTHNLDILKILFCISYGIVPILLLLLTWYLCHIGRPSLYLWPALSIGVATLPGQLFFVSEANLVPQVFWPILISIFSRLTLAHFSLITCLSLIAFELHPISAALFVFMSVATVISVIRRPQSSRGRWLLAVFFLALATARFLQPRDSYENELLTLGTIAYSFQAAIQGPPLKAITCAVLAGIVVLALPHWRGFSPDNPGRLLRFAPVALVLGAGVILVPWARDATGWPHLIDFRFMVVPISVAFMTMAAADGFRRHTSLSHEDRRYWTQRLLVVQATSVVFAVVLGFQSLTWLRLSSQLTADLRDTAGRCVSLNSMTWLTATALDHWATPTYAVLLQGYRPESLVLPEPGCRQLREERNVPLAPGLVLPVRGDPFDFSEVVG